MKTVLQHSLRAIVGILLLQFSSAVQAFTLITLPEFVSPSSSITDATTLNTQVQPVIGAIRAHLFDTRRKNKSKSSAQHGNVLAANSYVENTSDLDNMMVSYHGQDGGGAQSLWINSTFTSFENDFTRTRFNGDSHLLLAGFDYTISDKYIFGVAFGYETSNINTTFNVGNEEIDGFNISPYFAFLLSDSWSIDLGIGHGEFDTDQFRTLAVTPPLPTTIGSKFASTRDFIAMNLTNVSNRGNWFLTSSIGLLAVSKDQEAYVENGGAAVASSSLDMNQLNLAGEAAYSHDDSESYVGIIYEKMTDFDELQLTTGVQPANDDDSALLMLGWRYYGADLTANFEINSRLGQEDSSEYSILSTLRIDI